MLIDLQKGRLSGRPVNVIQAENEIYFTLSSCCSIFSKISIISFSKPGLVSAKRHSKIVLLIS